MNMKRVIAVIFVQFMAIQKKVDIFVRNASSICAKSVKMLKQIILMKNQNNVVITILYSNFICIMKNVKENVEGYLSITIGKLLNLTLVKVFIILSTMDLDLKMH